MKKLQLQVKCFTIGKEIKIRVSTKKQKKSGQWIKDSMCSKV